MKMKFTKSIFLAFLLVASTGLLNLFAAGPMKDIELDPGKTINEGNMLNVFPTLAADQVTIHFWFETDGTAAIRVFDLTGKQVDPTTTGNITHARTYESVLDVSQLNNGIYFVEVSNNGVKMVSKIIVNH